MNALRALATTAAGVWLGGMILIAIVAATTFSEMRQTGVEHPNAVAGQVMAKNFSRFDKLQMVCAAVLLVWQTAQLVVGRRRLGDWLRTAMILSAVGLLIYSAWVLTPRILDLQTAVASANPDAAVKAVFDEFHRTAVRVSKINLLLLAAIVLSLAWRPLRGKPAGEGLRRTQEIGGSAT